ncbi:protein RESISTANCE TO PHYTOPHTHORA 1, chloroplastic isoform X2 [Euphorbia lathyris]|uniref:protein RESISTANCE TO PHYTOPHTHORA 1, chloroplastic isoform X2 n=1 Tax=Euphorbia lathyris TaxID=212925 RepID=UPI003313FBC6
MNSVISSSVCNYQISRLPFTPANPRYRHSFCNIKNLKVSSTAKEVDSQTEEGSPEQEPNETSKTFTPTSSALDKNLKKAVQKTAATFAPRASTASKNPAVPGSALYSVFEVQAYISMLLGGALSFNLIFPSNEPDIWRLMGMWSIWMFNTFAFFGMYAWKMGWLQKTE